MIPILTFVSDSTIILKYIETAMTENRREYLDSTKAFNFIYPILTSGWL